MPRFAVASITWSCVCSLLFASPLLAETITDSNFNFTLELPDQFQPRPDLVGATPDIVHAFQYGEGSEDEIPILLFIEKLGGVIGKEHLKKEQMPASFQGELFITQWQGHDVDGFEVPESVNGIDTVTYNVQIPLLRQAIQVKLFGAADQRETLEPLLRQILDGLEGKSNWLSSAIPSTIANSENYGTILLVVAIVGMVLGLVLLWFLSRHTPKGTVFAVAIALFLLSGPLYDNDIREIRLLFAAMRLLGFAGVIVGVIDLFRRGTTELPSDNAKSE